MDGTTVTSENNITTMNNPELFKKTGLGRRLRSAREAMQLTEKEAAARLHLNASMITLIEDENFAEGPPATFMRGYLRSYAKLLRLSENEITLTLKDLENAIPSSSNITAVPVISTKPQQYHDRYLRWLTYVIILVLITLVSMWWKSHSRYVIATLPSVQPKTDVTPVTTTVPAESKPAATVAQTPATPAATTPAAVAATATSPTAPTMTTTPTAPATTPVAPIAQTQTPAPLQNAQVPVTTPAPAPTVSEASKPAKHSSLPHMRMALPEPDTDANPDENNND